MQNLGIYRGGPVNVVKMRNFVRKVVGRVIGGVGGGGKRVCFVRTMSGALITICVPSRNDVRMDNPIHVRAGWWHGQLYEHSNRGAVFLHVISPCASAKIMNFAVCAGNIHKMDFAVGVGKHVRTNTIGTEREGSWSQGTSWDVPFKALRYVIHTPLSCRSATGNVPNCERN